MRKFGPGSQESRVDRRSHYNLMRDPVYAEAFRQAVQEAGDALEDKLNELAHDGNVTAAIFLLKGLRPLKYKERTNLTDLLDRDPAKLTPEILEALIDHVLKKVGVGGPNASPETLAAIRKQLQALVPVDAAYQVQGDVPESRGE